MNTFNHWNTQITIYNKYVDPTTHITTWYRKTVSNCFWKNTVTRVTNGNAIVEQNGYVCRIPEQTDYIDKCYWDILADKTSMFTLAQDDIIIKGVVTDVISEYTPGCHSTNIMEKYKGNCLIVTSTSINTYNGLQTKHYCVRGV